MEGMFRPTVNLGNSVIGVGILAMPYCFEKCGLILGILLLIASATFTTWSLKMLVRSAQISRKSSYEQLAFHTFGRHGKLVIELSIIGLTIGCLISFFIVIGDLAPPIVAISLGVDWSPVYLRMFLMIFLALTVSLPLSLLRNVDSLSGLAMGSLFFYSCLLIRIVYMSLSTVANGDVWNSISLFKIDGLLHCLPICALALACHPQMFVIYVQMIDPSVRRMSTVINGAVYLVAMGYGIMAFFGYLNFVQDGIKGDVLANFPHDPVSQFFRFGFSLSVVVSFPLVVFPVRASIYSLCFSKSSGMELHGVEPIPQNKFNLITFAIILSTLTVALLVPNVEAVLALTGATTGSIICYIFPSFIFLSVVGSHATFSNRAKFLFVLGCLVMVVGTFTIISEHINSVEKPTSLEKTNKYPRPFIEPPAPPIIKGPPIVDEFKIPNRGIDINSNNDVIGGDVIPNGELNIPAFNPVVNDDGVERGEGDGGGVGGEGGGLQEEHDSIKKDMEELKERVKAVEEENQELKEVLEKKTIGEEAAVGVQAPPQDNTMIDDNDGDVNKQQQQQQQDRKHDEYIDQQIDNTMIDDNDGDVNKQQQQQQQQDRKHDEYIDQQIEEHDVGYREMERQDQQDEERFNVVEGNREDVRLEEERDRVWKQEVEQEIDDNNMMVNKREVDGERAGEGDSVEEREEEGRKVRELKEVRTGNNKRKLFL